MRKNAGTMNALRRLLRSLFGSGASDRRRGERRSDVDRRTLPMPPPVDRRSGSERRSGNDRRAS